MFQNRITAFDPEAFFSVPPQSSPQDSKPEPVRQTMPIPMPMLVRTADIFQAARNQAIQDHELDKLFNPEFYDYQI